MSNKATVPSDFRIKSIEMINHEGNPLYVQNIMTSFSITESLYSNTLFLKMSFKDSVNFFETFPIVGQETIIIRVTKDHSTIELNLRFRVTDYPTFGKVQSQHVQVFTLSGVSEFAFGSKFKKISRGVSDTSTNIIRKVLEGDLNVDPANISVSDDCSSTFSGIINTQTPLSACEWIRSRAFAEDLTPIFLFQTLDGKINVKSLTSLISEDSYSTYIDSREYNVDPLSEEDFKQRNSRILSVSSDLKLGKVFPSQSGAFASKRYYLDISNKLFTSDEYSYSISDNTIEKRKPFSSADEIFQGEPLESLSDSHIEYIPLNGKSHDTSSNINELIRGQGGRTDSHIETLESLTHDIRLFGDFGLNPGKKITLKFPRAIDPNEQKNLLGKSRTDLYDRHLSGQYIITSVVHTFMDDEYFSDVRVKRDSFSIEI